MSDVRTMTAGELNVLVCESHKHGPVSTLAAALVELTRRAAMWERLETFIRERKDDDCELYITGSGQACVHLSRGSSSLAPILHSAATLRAAVEKALQEPQP